MWDPYIGSNYILLVSTEKELETKESRGNGIYTFTVTGRRHDEGDSIGTSRGD
jgi:hypothetical protein